MIEGLVTSPAILAIGWSLIGFVWQGSVVAALTALALFFLRKCDPRVRYAATCLGLLVMVALPVTTAVRIYSGSLLTDTVSFPPPPAVGRIAATDLTHVPAPADSVVRQPGSAVPAATGDTRRNSGGASLIARIAGNTRSLEGWLPSLVLIWLAGVFLLSLRLAGASILVRRLVRRGVPISGDLSSRMGDLARRLGLGRRIRTLESSLVTVPTVVGWLRPAVLIPTSALAGLSPEQLEAVIAHELAHIRRHDYAVNLLQRASETLLFYHPAVWWVSNRVRLERELCADELAVTACGDATLYADALRNLEVIRRQPALALAASGGSLLTRIGRLLGQPVSSDRWSPGWAALVLVAALAGMVAVSEGTVASTRPESVGTVQSDGAPEPPAANRQELRAALEALFPEELQVREQAERDATVARRAAESTREIAELSGRVAQQANPNGTIAPVPPEPPEPPAPPVPAPPRPPVVVSGQGRVVAPFTNTTAWMGVTLTDGADQGAMVQSVEAGSPAATAGIESGDLITELDGLQVVGVRQLTRMIQETPVGRSVRVTILRDGAAEVREVTLAEAPGPQIFHSLDEYRDQLTAYRDQLAGYFPLVSGPSLRLGLEVQDMTPDLRGFFGADADAGVLVSVVDDTGAAADAGIQVGDVIVAMDGNPVESRADLTVSREIDDDTIRLTVIRDRMRQNIDLTLDVPPRSFRIVP